MLNFLSPDLRRNPFPFYEKIRSTSPVLHVPEANVWMILDYDGVKRALNDHDAFSSSMMTAGRRAPEWLIFLDPPRQTKLRNIILRAFTPASIANLESRIRAFSRELLDNVIERGEMDLASDYSVPLPTMVIADMIGIPTADWARFKRWSDGILNLSYTVAQTAASAAAIAEYRTITEEMSAYIPELIEQKRAAKHDDLLTRLVEAEVDGERLTHADILAFLQILLVAGQETTANLINNAIICLTDNPDQFARVKSDRALLPAAIEEVLRYRSPFQWMLRASRQEIEMHGQTIPAGKLVLPVIGSANRDPKQFADPNRFDITRDPNPHIAFGHGIHFCLGAALSRLEAKIALGDLLDRVTDLQIASAGPWEPRKALHVHGPSSLPVRFNPGRRAAEA